MTILATQRSNLKLIYYGILLFMFIYMPPLTSLPYNPSKFATLLVIGEAILFKRYHFPKWVVGIYGMYILLFLYTITILLVQGTLSSQTAPLEQMVTQCLEGILFILFLFELMRVQGFHMFDAIKLFVLVTIAQSLIMFLGALNFEFRDTILELQGREAKRSGDFMWFRGNALGLYRQYDLALFQSFSLILMTTSVYQSIFKKWQTYLFIFLIIAAIFFSGRTGFLGLGIALAIYLSQTVTFQKIILFVRNIIVLFLFSVGVFFATKSLAPDFYKNLNDNILPWALELYYNYSEEGALTTESSDNLINDHYFAIPDGSIAFGEGKYNQANGMFYLRTDAGYMRQTLYFGVVGILLYVILLSLIASQVYSTVPRYLKTERYLGWILLVCLLLVHIKGDVFTNSIILLKGFFFITFSFTYWGKLSNTLKNISSSLAPTQ